MRRVYRELFSLDGFKSWETTYKETNLFIKACKDLRFEVFKVVKRSWEELLEYIEKNRDFLTALKPVKHDKYAPPIAKKMIEASSKADVGPMASVAGAIAEVVGKMILKECSECVVENGGDIFLKLEREPTVGIYTNNSYFKDNLIIKVKTKGTPISICSSSAKIGPSLSLGKADLTVIISNDGAFSDAMATKTANMIEKPEDIEKAIDFSRSRGVDGCLFIKDKSIGLWGNIELV